MMNVYNTSPTDSSSFGAWKIWITLISIIHNVVQFYNIRENVSLILY